MERIEALELVASHVDDDALVIAALGGTSDEWSLVRPSAGNFYNSAMGSNLPLAVGLARALPHRQIVLLDTDGCLLMTLGALCTLGNCQPDNLNVFVMDNGEYAATGGQPSATRGNADLCELARAAGVAQAIGVETRDALAAAATDLFGRSGLGFVVVKVDSPRGRAIDRGRDHVEDTYAFIHHVEELEDVRILKGV